MNGPEVSVVIAAYNAGTFLDGAVHSALSQTLRDLEVVVVDDGSSDDTLDVAEGMAAADPRLRVLRNGTNRGPAFTRNAAIDAARGRWIAVLDADDRMQPGRLAHLLAIAHEGGHDIVADNLLFTEQHGQPPFDRLFGDKAFNGEGRIDLTPQRFLQLNPAGGNRGVGLVKPLIRRQAIQHAGVRYREQMRLAEDLFFYLDLLLAGARMVVVREAWYDYLVRAASLSRSKKADDIERMIQAFEQVAATAPDAGVRAQLRQDSADMRRTGLPRQRLKEALRAGRFDRAAALLLAQPLLPWRLLQHRWARRAA